MSTTSDPLPDHLDRIGRQLTAAAGEVLRPPVHRVRHTVRLLALSTTVAAAAMIAGLALSGTTDTEAAYALTSHADGTYTVSLTNIATGIPALNAKLKHLGIDETAVPIEQSCAGPSVGPGSLLESRGSMSETVTVGKRWNEPGQHGVLAAEQMRNGQVLIAMGTTRGAIPLCFAPPTTGS